MLGWIRLRGGVVGALDLEMSQSCCLHSAQCRLGLLRRLDAPSICLSRSVVQSHISSRTVMGNLTLN